MAPEPENGSNQTDQTSFSTFSAETYHDIQIKQLISYQKDQVYDRDVSRHALQSSLNCFLLTPLETMGCHMETCLLWTFLKTSFPTSYGCLILQKAGDTVQSTALITECQGVSHSRSGAKLLIFLPLRDDGFSKWLKHIKYRIGSICFLTNTVF